MTSSSNPIFSGHFGDGRVSQDKFYYIRSHGLADTVWSVQEGQGGAVSTINNSRLYLPIKFVESLCNTKRTFVSMVPDGNDNFVLSFDPDTKVLTVRQSPNPIQQSLDVTLDQTLGGICRQNEHYGRTQDATRVWVSNTCHGEFSRSDGAKVSCSAPEGKYSECAFPDPRHDLDVDIMTGACFEIVAGLDTSVDGGLSIRVGWLGSPDTFLMVDANDGALVKAAPFLNTASYRQDATWYIEELVAPVQQSSPLPIPTPSPLPTHQTTAEPTGEPRLEAQQSQSLLTPLSISVLVMAGIFLGFIIKAE